MAVYLVPVDQGRTVVLDKAIMFIGRHPECDIVLTRSRRVSRKHCCIAQVNDHFVVRDLGSTNGVRINGRRIGHESAVSIGDEVAIGDVRYVLEQKAGAVSAQRRRAAAEPSQRTDLSQDFPIPISDDGENFGSVSGPGLSEGLPIREQDAAGIDLPPPDESDGRKDSDSHQEP